MAVLVRAWKDAGPIVEVLRRAEVPYLGGGMNSLFDTPEAEAIREVFYFLANHAPRNAPPVSEASLREGIELGSRDLLKRTSVVDFNSYVRF